MVERELVLEIVANQVCLSNAAATGHNGEARKPMGYFAFLPQFAYFLFPSVEFHGSASLAHKPTVGNHAVGNGVVVYHIQRNAINKATRWFDKSNHRCIMAA